MWRHALLGAALCATLTKAAHHGYARQEAISSTLNSSSSASLGASPSQETSSPITITLVSDTSTTSSSLASSSSLTTSSSSVSTGTSTSSGTSASSESSMSSKSSTPLESSTSSKSSTSSESSASSESSTSSTSSGSSTSSISITSTPSASLNSSTISLSSANSTSLVKANGTTPASVECTGCVLEAFLPITTWFDEEEQPPWESVAVTETVITSFTTYMLNASQIDTVVTNIYTVNQTSTFIGTDNNTITHTAKVFTWEIASEITLTLPSGPTYVGYTNIWGGPDIPLPVETQATTTEEVVTVLTPVPPQQTCEADPMALTLGFQEIMPTLTEDWFSFIQTYSDEPPPKSAYETASLPAIILQYLESKTEIQEIFEGYNLEECTQGPTRTIPVSYFGSSRTQRPHFTFGTEEPAPSETPPPAEFSQSSIFATFTTGTFLSTSYEHTEKYTTISGPLRRSKDESPPDKPTDTFNVKTPEVNPQPNPKPSDKPDERPNPPDKPNEKPSEKPNERPRPSGKPEEQKPGPTDIPGLLVSLINDPNFTPAPNPNPNPTPGPRPQNPGQSITVGDSVFQIRPAQPTDPSKPNDPNRENPAIVIGTDTLTPGQVTTINGVEVSVPPPGPNGERPSIVVGGSTIGVNPNPTGPPVLTVGDTTVTADPQGHFVVGTETLTPGGPAITVDGSTLSLGPSGTIAVINGVTQTLGFAPAPTGGPVLTVDGKTISATVIGGSTVFALGPDKTLTPGGVLTVDGTTFSLPADGKGSTVVVNGVTSTLNNPALPVITVNSQSITASVHDGSTVFVLGPDKTLTPGGVVTVDGTTFSLPADGSGSTIIVNGVTSTLTGGGLPVITLNSQSITATVQGGTTAFILGPSATLTPGGVLTISGTTFSMPASASGSVVVINGVTSTLGESPITAAAALTIDGKTYSATVRDGTTEYVLGPGTTLKPGESITVSGTTYSLDEKGTALVINGKTSTIPRTPASNSATTTRSGSESGSKSGSTGASSKRSGSKSHRSSSSSSSTSERDPGNFIASGIGVSSKAGAYSAPSVGLDKWVEGMVIGLAGWLLLWL